MSFRLYLTLIFLVFSLTACQSATSEISPTAAPPISTSFTQAPAPLTDTPTNQPELSATATYAPPPSITEPGQMWVSPLDGMEMVGVPAGEFTMGRNDGDDDEGPAHSVYLDSFYIDKFEVTHAQYRICVEAGACATPDKTEYYQNPALEQHPVVNVARAWAITYCSWAGKRLPTEAEWEKAARGTDGRTYPWGEEIDCEHAQYQACGGQTAPVGSRLPGVSPYGAMDMAGNVWEWVSDRYEEDYYQNSPDSNPQGPDPKKGDAWMDAWVIRGGSWSEEAAYVRSTYRSWYNPNAQYYNLGFRCVYEAP